MSFLAARLNGRDTLQESMGCQEMGVTQSQSTKDNRSLPARIMAGEISAIALSIMDNPKKRSDCDISSNVCV